MDTRLLAKPKPFGGAEDEWAGWSFKMMAYLSALVAKMADELVHAIVLPLEQVKRVTSRDWEPLSSQNPSKPPQSLQRVVSSPAPQLSPSVSREQLRLSMRSKLRQSASRQNHSVTVRDCVPLSPHSLPKPLQAP